MCLIIFWVISIQKNEKESKLISIVSDKFCNLEMFSWKQTDNIYQRFIPPHTSITPAPSSYPYHPPLIPPPCLPFLLPPPLWFPSLKSSPRHLPFPLIYPPPHLSHPLTNPFFTSCLIQ